jgi:branched-chain amino acid aminotransferase
MHMSRLASSASELHLTESLRTVALGDAVIATLRHNELQEARVRLTLTGGPLNIRTRESGGSDPTILVHAQPPTQYPEAIYEQGIRVAVANDRLSPFDSRAGHKTLAYWARLASLQEAGAHGAAESLWFTVSNHLASGSTSNVLLVREGVLLSPFAHGEELEGALPSPVRPGVTREVLFEIARENGIAVELCMLDIDQLLSADEVLLCNSGWGVLPVTEVERAKIGTGNPGEVFQSLRKGLEQLVDRETRFGLDPATT